MGTEHDLQHRVVRAQRHVEADALLPFLSADLAARDALIGLAAWSETYKHNQAGAAIFSWRR